MKYLISGGLPDLPVGLKDAEYNLVAPIYRAVNSLAGATAVQTNAVQYSPGDLLNLSPILPILKERTNRIFVKAGETLGYGVLVYLTIVDGKFVAFKADNTIGTGHRAVACIDSFGGIALGDFGEAVFMRGLCPGISGTVLGQQYYLGTAGAATASQTLSTIQQPVGIGLGTAGLYLTVQAETLHVVAVADSEVVHPSGPHGARKLCIY